LEVADGQTTGKVIQHLLRDSFVSEHLELLEYRGTTIAGKPVSTLRGIVRKCCPSFLLGSLLSARLDCFIIFARNRHECVTVFIIKFMLFSRFAVFFVCLALIFWSEKPF